MSKPELKRGTSRTDLIRQLSKQRSILEQQAAAEDKEEAAKKNVLITEEKAETGSVSGSHLTIIYTFTEYFNCTHTLNILAGFCFFSPRNVCSCYTSG